MPSEAMPAGCKKSLPEKTGDDETGIYRAVDAWKPDAHIRNVVSRTWIAQWAARLAGGSEPFQHSEKVSHLPYTVGIWQDSCHFKPWLGSDWVVDPGLYSAYQPTKPPRLDLAASHL